MTGGVKSSSNAPGTPVELAPGTMTTDAVPVLPARSGIRSACHTPLESRASETLVLQSACGASDHVPPPAARQGEDVRHACSTAICPPPPLASPSCNVARLAPAPRSNRKAATLRGPFGALATSTPPGGGDPGAVETCSKRSPGSSSGSRPAHEDARMARRGRDGRADGELHDGDENFAHDGRRHQHGRRPGGESPSRRDKRHHGASPRSDWVG